MLITELKCQVTYEERGCGWLLYQIFCNVCCNSLYYDAKRSNKHLEKWLQSHPKMQEMLSNNDLDDTLMLNAAEFSELVQKKSEEICLPRTSIIYMDYFKKDVCKLIVLMNFCELFCN